MVSHMQLENGTAAREIRGTSTGSPPAANASSEPLSANSRASFATQTYGILDNALNLNVPQVLVCITHSTDHLGWVGRCKRS